MGGWASWLPWGRWLLCQRVQPDSRVDPAFVDTVVCPGLKSHGLLEDWHFGRIIYRSRSSTVGEKQGLAVVAKRL